MYIHAMILSSLNEIFLKRQVILFLASPSRNPLPFANMEGVSFLWGGGFYIELSL
jgi:hypothetical protein